MVVGFFAGVRVSVTARDAVAAFLVAAFVAGAFFAGALVAGALVVGAFLAAAVRPVGVRVGVAVAAVSFFRAVRAVVAVGLPPGVFAALAPVARFVAAATFFAATFFCIGAFFAPTAFRALPFVASPMSLLSAARRRAGDLRCRLAAPVSSPHPGSQTRSVPTRGGRAHSAPARPEGRTGQLSRNVWVCGLSIGRRRAPAVSAPLNRSTSTPREMSLAMISPLYQYVDHWLDRMS